MSNFEFLFLLFLGFLAAIVFGIFIGFPMGQRNVLKARSHERESIRHRAFARLERARESAKCSLKRSDILDSEVIE